jgi:hypothetical protein
MPHEELTKCSWKEVGWIALYVALIGLGVWMLVTYMPR